MAAASDATPTTSKNTPVEPSDGSPDTPTTPAAADLKDSTWYTNHSSDTFQEMNLPRPVLKGIFSYGFDKPSGVQSMAIRPVMDRRDVIVQAQSGTGKTGAFLIGSLARIADKGKKSRHPRVLVISPSRELAEQTNQVCTSIASFMEDHRTCLLIGGTNTHDNMKDLDSACSIAIGTPGRIYDMMARGYFNTSELELLVIDEADEMLKMGFKDQIREIFKFVQKHTQVCLFSATMPQEAIEISKLFMTDPIKILVKAEETTLDGIKQFYLGVEDESWKFMALCDLFEKLQMSACFIYCNSKKKAEFVREQLMANDFIAACIHGKMPYSERRSIMQQFRSGKVKVLISTDLTARGIDVQQVFSVINYDLPREKETYIHRIGRSGRYGRKGIAINFVNKDEMPMLQEIETFYHTNIEPLPADIKDKLKASS